MQSYDLSISFRTVFDGRDDGTGGGVAADDIFSAVLSGAFGSLPLFSQTSAGFPPNAPIDSSRPNNQLISDPSSTFLLGLAPGSYTLTFTLDEKSTGAFTNTAAGVDSASAFATAHLSVPEPGTLALPGIAMVAMGVSRRNHSSGHVRA